MFPWYYISFKIESNGAYHFVASGTLNYRLPQEGSNQPLMVETQHRGTNQLITSCRQRGIVGGSRKGWEGRQLVTNDRE